MGDTNKVKRRSLIKKYISDELYLDILKVTLISDIDNNEKSIMIKDLLTKNSIPWSGLGNGTNRFAVQVDGYALKIALDVDGKIDCRREMLYTKALQPYAVKAYECTPDGLLCVEEYVDILDKSDFDDPSVQKEMREILGELSQMFLIGDVGINSKNYVNWGRRPDGSLVMLDFAYIYDVKYGTFTCSHCDDEAILQYDNNFDKLICPKCGTKYTFGMIRRRITREMQEAEIGDIRRLSYNIHSAEEEVDLVPEFEPEDPRKKKKEKEKSEGEILLENYYKNLNLNDEDDQDWDNPDQSQI